MNARLNQSYLALNTLYANSPEEWKKCVIEAYCNDLTIFAKDRYTCRCHQPLPVPDDSLNATEFFAEWQSLVKRSFEDLPLFLQNTFEIKALQNLLRNKIFIDLAYNAVKQHDSVRKGLLSLSDVHIVSSMPQTAKAEFFTFLQYAVAPYNHIYPRCDSLIMKNANLMDLLLIGHNQFDLLIFDRALVGSHAVSFALKMGIPLIVTNDPMPVSQDELVVKLLPPTPENDHDDCVPHALKLDVIKESSQSSKKDVCYG